MDWDKAIERNELPLFRIVSALFALLVSARLAGSGLMIPRHVWRSILFVLRPSESAVRRLIIIAARTLVCAAPASRLRSLMLRDHPLTHLRVPFQWTPVFQLFDPLKRFDITLDDGERFSDGAATFVTDDLDDVPVNAEPLHYRLRALRNALADLSKQAERLARHNARRDAPGNEFRPIRLSPMRPGLPPGWRERPHHEIDGVLRECHRLVRYLEDTQYRADTS